MSGLSGVSLRYDRAEDRLALSFPGADGTQRFWITRRQCAGLIKSLGPAARKAAAQVSLPRGKGPAAAAAPPGEAPALAVIAMRKSPKAVRLLFRRDGGEAVLECSAAEFVKLQCLIYRLADAAQWMPGASAPVKAAAGARAPGARAPGARAPGRRLH